MKRINFERFYVNRVIFRDLLKWCQRVSIHICQYGVEDISLSVALSAMDCFVASCPRANTRLLMTETIAVELNISSDKVSSTREVAYFTNHVSPFSQKLILRLMYGSVSALCFIAFKSKDRVFCLMSFIR